MISRSQSIDQLKKDIPPSTLNKVTRFANNSKSRALPASVLNSQNKIRNQKTRNFDLYEDAGSSDSRESRDLEVYNARMYELLGGGDSKDDLVNNHAAAVDDAADAEKLFVYKGPSQVLENFSQSQLDLVQATTALESTHLSVFKSLDTSKFMTEQKPKFTGVIQQKDGKMMQAQP